MEGDGPFLSSRSWCVVWREGTCPVAPVSLSLTPNSLSCDEAETSLEVQNGVFALSSIQLGTACGDILAERTVT